MKTALRDLKVDVVKGVPQVLAAVPGEMANAAKHWLQTAVKVGSSVCNLGMHGVPINRCSHL